MTASASLSARRPKLAQILGTALCFSVGRAAPIQLGTRLEPFVDTALVERLDNVRHELSQPREEEIVFRFGEPWERATGYVSVLKDGGLYRMYYRGVPDGVGGEFDDTQEVTCYAESRDGI